METYAPAIVAAIVAAIVSTLTTAVYDSIKRVSAARRAKAMREVWSYLWHQPSELFVPEDQILQNCSQLAHLRKSGALLDEMWAAGFIEKHPTTRSYRGSAFIGRRGPSGLALEPYI